MKIESPILDNDCFSLPKGVRWIPVEDALDRLQESLHSVVKTEWVNLDQATNRVLSENIFATRSSPPSDNSAVDGFGFSLKTLQHGPQNLPLVKGRAAAGEPYKGTITPGSAIKILTGAILPDGVDTVILEEDTQLELNSVTFNSTLKLGANTRMSGEDAKSGEIVLSEGNILRSPDIALLVSVGVFCVLVYKKLSVGVLSTGTEIITKTTTTPLRHQIYDANRPMLLSVIRKWGFTAEDLGHAKDDQDTVLEKLNNGVKKVDVIITTGGASSGEEDYISKLLKEKGSISSWRVAIKPGRPIAMGMWQGKPIFGLPGNPVAAFVCTAIFVRPALSLLSGSKWKEPVGFLVPAAFSKIKKPGRREFLRGLLQDDGSVKAFKSEGSGRISSLSWANGLIDLPSEALDISPGDFVRFIPYTSLGI
ncbi:MAG: molybdopterin molybdotransferase [Paracoccaceae bacterium]